MKARIVAAALVAVISAPVLASAQAMAPAAAEAPQQDLVPVALETEAGRIVLALDRARAPITTRNFLRYLDAGRLNGITFYRAMNLWEGAGLVQAGVREAAKLYPPIEHEPTSKTGILHEDGTISMARGAPGSAQADFFITVGKIDGFDAGGDPSSDNLGYAAFGRVVEGMDVVKRLLAAPVSPTKGEREGMKGQILETPVKILKAERVS